MFKDTVVNRAFPFMHKESLKIMHTIFKLSQNLKKEALLKS